MPSPHAKPSGSTPPVAGRPKTTPPSSGSSPASPDHNHGTPAPPGSRGAGATTRRRPKRPGPSFDLARGALGDSSGWVYRSDSAPVIVDLPGTAVEVAPAGRPRTIADRMESGAGLLLSPFTLSLMILFAKMRWII